MGIEEPDLHAVQCGAGAAHAAGSEAALLGQRAVAQGEQLAAQTQVLPAQHRLKATLSVLTEQLATPADVLRAELGEGRSAVSIVPGLRKDQKKRSGEKRNYYYTDVIFHVTLNLHHAIQNTFLFSEVI